MKRQNFTFPWFMALLIMILMVTACNQATALSATPTVLPQATVSSPVQGADSSGNETLTLENTPWVLRDFPNAGLRPSLALFPVTLQLNPSETSASGVSACNQYSTPYTLNGSQLTFGPVLSTQMACEGVRGVIESTYQPVLAQVASYQIRGDSLILNDSQGATLLRFAIDPFATTAAFTFEELANATYRSTLTAGGAITLTDGSYRADTQGSSVQNEVILTNFAVFGDVTGDGQEDAVLILFSSVAGTQTFYNLVIVQRQDGQLVDTQSSIGERLQINNLRLASRDIVLEILAPGSDDPVCCPSMLALQRYRWTNGQLQMVGANQSD